MNIERSLKHLLMTQWQVRRAFPRKTLTAIEHAVKEAEKGHAGEIRFAVEGALHNAALFRKESPRERAIEVFSQLRVWDTEHNNGVLIFVLLADRAVEIVADRGIHARVDGREWAAICREMEAAFKHGRFEEGAVAGVKGVARVLAGHFPPAKKTRNELPDRPEII